MDKTSHGKDRCEKRWSERHPLEWEDLNQHPERKEKRRVRKEFLILLLFVLMSAFFPSFLLPGD